MEKTLFQDIPIHLRPSVLRDNAKSSEKTSYLKDLTDEELDVKRETLTTNCIKVFRLEKELKEIKDGYKDRMDPLKEETRELAEQVDTRKELVTGEIFNYPDYEESVMYTFDERGEFVSSRRLDPKEKQLPIPMSVGHRRTAEE